MADYEIGNNRCDRTKFDNGLKRILAYWRLPRRNPFILKRGFSRPSLPGKSIKPGYLMNKKTHTDIIRKQLRWCMINFVFFRTIWKNIFIFIVLLVFPSPVMARKRWNYTFYDRLLSRILFFVLSKCPCTFFNYRENPQKSGTYSHKEGCSRRHRFRLFHRRSQTVMIESPNGIIIVNISCYYENK